MKKILEDYWQVLNDFEDRIKYGIRSDEKKELVSRSIEEEDSLDIIAAEISECTKCELCRKRRNTVPGAGSPGPAVLIIGEGPGAEEDAQGIPFVGAAGKYLDKWLEALNLSREKNCFIGNVVKCRPPGNRDPLPEEISACIGYLRRQIKILKPEAILTVGRISSAVITGAEGGIGRIRGKVYSYESIPVVATYHPSAVLRDRGYRAPVWEDLKLLREILDRQNN